MKRTRRVHLKQLQKYAMFQEAVRWNEGFQWETDAAFADFWEREGDSLRNRRLIEKDADANALSSTSLGELIEKPDSDPLVLDAYCYSPEALLVCKRYGLRCPYHYNQPGLVSLGVGEIGIVSMIHADGWVGEIDGKTVWIFRSPCLQAVRDLSVDWLDIKIDLTSWPKEEIMAVLEIALDDALQERKRIGKKTKRRGVAVDEDALPFKAWVMHKKKGMTSWDIAQELFPFIKGKSPREFEENYHPEARSCLRKVERALKKADKLISSVTPTN